MGKGTEPMTQSRWILLSVLLISFLGPFMGSSINMAIPAMALEFSLPAEQLSWVVTVYLVGSASVLLPFGKLADIVGRKRMFRFGLWAVLATTVGSGFAANVNLLIVWRMLQGISLSMIFSTSMAMLVSSHKPSERGRVIGLSAAATYIGLSTGPVLGGLITEHLGWRPIFFLTAAGLLLSIVAVNKVEDEWYGEKEETLDLWGSFLYFAGSVMTLYGLSASADHVGAKYILAAGVICFIFFLGQQRIAKHPLVDWQLFRSGIFALSNLAAMIHYSSTFALGFLLSLYLQLIRGFDASAAGVFLLLQPAMMALFSPLAGTLSDKVEPRLVASLGMGMTAVGLFFCSFLQADTSLGFLAGTLLFIGVGFAFFSSPNSNAIMGAVESKHYGVAAAVLSVMRIVGQALSMAVVTVLLTVYAADILSPFYLPSLIEAFHKIFIVLAAGCTLGVFISLGRGKRKA